VFRGSPVIDSLRVTSPDIGAVARSLVGISAIAMPALYLHSGAAAMWAAAAGGVASAVAMQDSPGRRVPLVVTVSLGMGAAVMLGSLTATYGALFVAVAAVWSFAAGMMWALGTQAGLVGAAGTALLIIAPATAPSLNSVLISTTVTIASGCVQALLIAVFPPRRWRVRAEALARTYRSLAADARRVATEPDAPVDAAPLTRLREVFVDSQASRRPEVYQGGYRLPERIAATLTALRCNPADGPNERVSAMLVAAGACLDALADHGHSARRDAEQTLLAVKAAAGAVEGREAATAQRFSQQLHEAAVLRFGQLRRPDLVGILGEAGTLLRSHCTWTSPILRHAIRLAVAVGVGVALARFAGLAHGYWTPLTVLMVLRPETAHTYTRCAGRLAGIAAGILVASTLTFVWLPSPAASLLLTVAFLGLTYGAARFGYLAVGAGLAAAIVFLVNVGGGAAGGNVEDTLFAVAIGGALAVGAHVVLPDHAMVRLRQRAGELLKSEIDYAATVIKVFVHDVHRPAEVLTAAWQRAFRARAAFEAASGTTRMDSSGLRRWLRGYRSALNAVTSACTSLESCLPGQPANALSSNFVAAVDDYVEALRGAPATPATPWTVDIAEVTSANQRVRDVASQLGPDNGPARVLVVEIGTITRSLADITPAREPTSAG
jgi:uncharacterized membrane protein YccC